MNMNNLSPANRLKWRFRLALVLVLMALLAACGGGGGGGGGTPFNPNPGGGQDILVIQSAEPIGINCATGGTRISAGLDVNGNNALEAGEVASTQFVCNLVSQTLLAITALPVGNAACAAGGQRIEAGADANGNGVLDSAEVSSTATVCNGTNGSNSLIVQTAEPAGANCATGGTRISSGVDGNGNNVLDAGEVTATSFVCNPAGAMAWVTVSASVQAQPNTGYLTDSAARVTVTLPANASLTPGDRVAVSGVGSGGWTLAQNAGQSISLKNLVPAAVTWTPRETTRGWWSVASSADGSKLVAVVQGGQIYTSTDSGENWTARENDRDWRSVASSADGSKLVAVVNNGQIYTSTDSGVSWTARESNRTWQSVASSADGSKLVAVPLGQIYTSTDGGVSWTARDSSRNWRSVASSADGSKLVAVAGRIYTSTDSGATWTARESNRNWQSVASSADGSKLVAVDNFGQIYTSTDSGVTWTPRETTRGWWSVASSADGSRLVAAVFNGQIYTSTDSGVSWTARDSNRNWQSVASSADGSKLMAVVQGGRIYTSMPFTTSGTGGSLSGGQFDMVELQYLGSGLFAPLRGLGSFTYQ